MRQYFFLLILVMAIVSGIIYYLWTMVSALYENWSMTKDVGKIEAESKQRRLQRQEQNAQRLDNGCDHVFGEALGGFPPNACRRCGLEKEPPVGPCDHVWRLAKEAVPCSYCEKCNRKYVSPTITGSAD